jgi:hypothetical protein
MLRIGMLLLFFLTTLSFAQDDGVVYEPDARPVVEDPEDEGSIDLDELEDIDITDDHTEDDEDIFVPTDEISYQQSVPFPTDI